MNEGSFWNPRTLYGTESTNDGGCVAGKEVRGARLQQMLEFEWRGTGTVTKQDCELRLRENPLVPNKLCSVRCIGRWSR